MGDFSSIIIEQKCNYVLKKFRLAKLVSWCKMAKTTQGEIHPVYSIYLNAFGYHTRKYVVNFRMVGTFRMFLQELVEVGNVKICDSLLDANNVVMKVSERSTVLTLTRNNAYI